MRQIPAFKIDGSSSSEDRAPIFVHRDAESIHVRREGTRALDELRADFTMEEAHGLFEVLQELLAKPSVAFP